MPPVFKAGERGYVGIFFMSDMQPAKNISSYLFLLLGAGLLAAAFFNYKSTAAMIARAERVSGEVVELELRGGGAGSRRSYAYYPKIKFTTPAGQQMVFSSSSGAKPPAYKVGEKVEVYYNADDPGGAMVNSFMSLWMISVILAVFGLVIFAVGIKGVRGS